MKCELKTGRKVELKNLTVDEKDELLDSVQYDMDGESVKVKMMHSTMTKFIRVAVKGDVADKFIGSLSFEEKSEIFTTIQNECMNLGEGKASK
tara:strand:+ start:848 stop:1126 length:279 start_codon:yes stop_codon:yes gene_type:complete